MHQWIVFAWSANEGLGGWILYTRLVFYYERPNAIFHLCKAYRTHFILLTLFSASFPCLLPFPIRRVLS